MIDTPCSYDELLAKFSAVCKERDELKKKQMPMKPILNPEDPYQFYCPSCRSIIGVDGQMSENDFCCDCGQALDWN